MNETNYETIDQLQGIYNVASDTSVSVIIEGVHGIGKSESVYDFCKEHNYHIEPLFLSHQEVADLIGIPTLLQDGEDSGVTVWSKPIWLKRLETNAAKGIRTVLFLDELNRAQSEVRQAALQLVLDKQIHEHKLPKTTVDGIDYDCFIVAAINPSDAGDYQVDELDPALMDRFLHYELKVNVDSWLNWASDKKISNIIIGFISANKSLLHAPEANAKIYPTPRSWAKLDELLKSFKNKNINNKALLYNIIGGKIGFTIGAQFLTYYNDHNIFVTPDEINDVVNKKWKSLKGTDYEKCIKISKTISKMIGDLEIPVLKELSKNMIDEYLTETGTFNTSKSIIVYLHSIPVEQLTVELKNLQSIKDGILYKKLSDIDPEKKLFFKVIERIKKLK